MRTHLAPVSPIRDRPAGPVIARPAAPGMPSGVNRLSAAEVLSRPGSCPGFAPGYNAVLTGPVPQGIGVRAGPADYWFGKSPCWRDTSHTPALPRRLATMELLMFRAFWNRLVNPTVKGSRR